MFSTLAEPKHRQVRPKEREKSRQIFRAFVPVAAGGFEAKEKDNKQMYFEIVSASGGYRARIRGGNHEIIFTTEVYTTKASARHACEVVKSNALLAPIHE